MSNSAPNWISESQSRKMIVAHWLMGQLNYMDANSNSQSYIIERMVGVQQCPNTIINSLNQFENDRENFKRRFINRYT